MGPEDAILSSLAGGEEALEVFVRQGQGDHRLSSVLRDSSGSHRVARDPWAEEVEVKGSCS
eukprot:747567-Hanusia_phi.AAC.3